VQTPLALSGRGAIKRRVSLTDISGFTHWLTMRSAVEFVAPERGEAAIIGTHSTTMSSEHEQHRSRFNGEYTEHPSEEPWAALELTLPHGRSPTGVVSFVECALVELTHEEVGAEFVSTSVAGVKRTQFIVVTPIPNERVLVHEPSDEAFDSILQLAVFHRGWTAARDAGEGGQ